MGFGLGDLISAGTLGIVDDPFGTEAAQEAALQANQQSMDVTRELGNRSLDLQEGIWNWQKSQAQPWTNAGLGALGQYQQQIASGFNFDPESDPVYQARLGELSKAIGASGAASGMLLSGRTLRGLREMTASELGSSYSRQRSAYQERLANLGNLINVGAGASTGISGIGSNFAATSANTLGNLSTALSQGYQNQGQINAAAAVAPFQNLMTLGQVAGGAMSGAGAIMGAV